MKTKHTPEPWVVMPVNESWYGVQHTHHKFTPLGSCQLTVDYCPESKSNAARIVACVNACAGMEDPAAEIAALRARVAELDAQVPKKPEPNWDEAPVWAQYWAVDEVGSAWWYEEKPRYLNDCWIRIRL